MNIKHLFGQCRPVNKCWCRLLREDVTHMQDLGGISPALDEVMFQTLCTSHGSCCLTASIDIWFYWITTASTHAPLLLWYSCSKLQHALASPLAHSCFSLGSRGYRGQHECLIGRWLELLGGAEQVQAIDCLLHRNSFRLQYFIPNNLGLRSNHLLLKWTVFTTTRK